MTFKPTFYGLFIDENEADSPHMAIAVNDNDPSLFIDECLLMELDMGIQMILGTLFSPYEDLSIKYDDWKKIISISKQLLQKSHFDDFFFTVYNAIKNTAIAGDSMYRMNNFGDNIWNEKDNYLMLLSDLEEWTNVAVNPEDTITLIGY